MTSLTRFFSPSVRYFTNGIQSLPLATLTFTIAGSSTPKVVYQDKAGTIPHADQVVADQYGRFPAIFLDGLYKAELKNAAGITETGWPIDNVGQDEQIVPFGIYQETVTYQENEMVTASTGDWYRSKINTNLGNEPTTSPTEWELIIIPLAANFTSDEAWATWSDVGGQISLNIDAAAIPISTATQTALNLKAVIANTALTGTATAETINATRLTASTGMTFGNAAQAGVTVLDWYEEGTFLPIVQGVSTAGTGTYTLQVGTYTRIGNTVTIAIQTAWTAHTGTGLMKITNLPFTPSATNFSSSVPYASAALTFGAGLFGVMAMTYGSTLVQPFGIDPTGVAAPAQSSLPASCLACHFSLTYTV